MLEIFISRSAGRWLFSIVIGRNCSRESLQTAVQPPLVGSYFLNKLAPADLIDRLETRSKSIEF